MTRWIPSGNWKFWRLFGTNASVYLVPDPDGFIWFAGDKAGYSRTLRDAAKKAETIEDRLAVNPVT